MKIHRLMFAIAQHEGWFPVGSGSNPEGSKSFRNHNPGNLRSSIFESSNVGGFSVFESDALGWHALYYDILKKRRGETSTGLTGDSTIKDLIDVWAPAEDHNSPIDYLNDVVVISGLAPDTKLEELFT